MMLAIGAFVCKLKQFVFVQNLKVVLLSLKFCRMLFSNRINAVQFYAIKPDYAINRYAINQNFSLTND